MEHLWHAVSVVNTMRMQEHLITELLTSTEGPKSAVRQDKGTCNHAEGA